MSDSAFNIDILVAHRGLQSRFPENTLLALKKAIDMGAKYIELDIQFSNDCLPIIYHDHNLQRVSAIEGQRLGLPSQRITRYFSL
jgi:glycerophosphoryl diester phosphodiesterase